MRALPEKLLPEVPDPQSPAQRSHLRQRGTNDGMSAGELQQEVCQPSAAEASHRKPQTVHLHLNLQLPFTSRTTPTR